MKVQVEIAILEKSILCGMIEKIVEAYMKKQSHYDSKELLKIISEELEAVKELNLVSFYGVSSFVRLEEGLLQIENKKEEKK